MRYKILKNENSLGFIQLMNNDKGHSAKLRTLRESSEDVEKLKDILQQVISDYDNNVEGIGVEEVINKLTGSGYSIEEVPDGDYKMQIVMKLNGINIGKSTPTALINNKDIGESICRNLIYNLKTQSIEKEQLFAKNIEKLTLKGNHTEAAKVVCSPELSILSYMGGKLAKEIIDAIFLINRANVDSDIIEKFLLARVAMVQDYDGASRAEDDAKWLLENKADLEPNIRFNLRLVIGNALASRKLWVSAENQYFAALQDSDGVDSSSKAWAYYNTGTVLYNQRRLEESLKAYCIAGDLWVSSDSTEKAIMAYMRKMRYVENKDKVQALLDIEEVLLHVNNKQDNIKDINLAYILGSLFFYKAQLLYDLGKIIETEKALLQCYERRSHILGIDSEMLATLAFLELVCKELRKVDKSLKWHDEWVKLRSYDDEPNLAIKEKLIDILNNNECSIKDFECLEAEIKNANDNLLLLCYYTTIASKIGIDNPTKALELLDNALQLGFNEKSKEVCIIYQIYAQIMQQIDRLPEAYEYLKKASEACPEQRALYPNLIYYAQRFSKRDDIYKFACKWSTFEEGNPIVWLILGSYYEEKGKNKDAYKAYKKALDLAPNEEENISKSIERVMSKIMESTDIEVRTTPKATDFLYERHSEESLTIEKRMINSLCNFKIMIEKFHTRDFWRHENGKVKWVTKPEKQAQLLLLLYLRSMFNSDVEVLEEVIIGEGRMDIYILIPPGIKVIIKLKMCGSGYSSTYTKGAIEQTIAYMKKKDCNIGFVMIFDARIRDQGMGFDEIYTIKNKNINTIIVNVSYNIPSKNSILKE